MRKHLSKIIVAFVMIGVFLAPIGFDRNQSKKTITLIKQEALAETFEFYGIDAGGTWQKTGNKTGTFTGSGSSYEDGPVGGIIGIGTGQWSATVSNGQILNGTFSFVSSAPNILDASGPWVGQTPAGTPTTTGNLTNLTLTSQQEAEAADLWACTFSNTSTWFKGCVLNFIYYIIWTPIAALTRVAAHILDFFIYYSISNQAYTNEFLNKAWGAVRDVANIFFIMVLLYIGLKTVLDLGGSNSKKLIANVVVFALLINFSLFTTKVVIDSSNILTRIFYSKINAVNPNGQPATGAVGEKSITVGLVKKFEPQQILAAKEDMGAAVAIMFIEILLMAFMISMFISVAILFVGRVVALWIMMIFSPLAFASYTVPFEIPGFGHRTWWDELLKNAFLAPIFVFFLYIVILFGDFLKNLTYVGSGNWYQNIMPVIIPFAIIYILLRKAKELAVKYSGELGQGLTSGVKTLGSFAGGLALGAATGGLATLGRGSLGRLGSVINRSGTLQTAEKQGGLKGAAARTLRRVGGYAAKGSFDLKGINVAGKNIGSVTGLRTGLKLDQAQQGGFEKIRSDKVTKRLRRAEELEVGPDEAKAKELNRAKIALHDLQDKYSGDLDEINQKIESTRTKLRDAKSGSDGSKKSKEEIAVYDEKLKALKRQKTALRKGLDFGTITHRDFDDYGTVINKDLNADFKKASVVGGEFDGLSIEKLEEDTIKKMQNAIDTESRNRKVRYAKSLATGGNKFVNFFTSLGQHSGKGANEAKNKILLSVKAEGGDKEKK